VSGRINLTITGVIALIFCFQDSSVRAQTSPAALPNLKLSKGGFVRDIAVQEDGKVIIAGFFTSVNEVTRNNLVRVNPNGTVDLTWNPAPNNEVLKVVTSGQDVFVGGIFTNIGGLSRNGLAKLNTQNSGKADPAWDPNRGYPPFWLSTLSVNGSYLYVGGSFSGIGGLSRRSLARLDIADSGAAE